MDDQAAKDNPPADFNKLDLSQLQGFSFGTQWSQEKPASSERGGGRPRPEGRDGPGTDRRDRRSFRRPAGGAELPAREGGAGQPGFRDGGEDRRPRPGGARDFRGPRRDSGDRGGRPGGAPGGFVPRGMPDRFPYESPFYTATFYPEDSSFSTLAQTIRKSCRTVELFEIARTVVAKHDRFIVVLAHRAPAEPAAAPADSPAPRPSRPMFHVAVPDGLPFESDEAAVAHVLARHLGVFFDSAEVEVEPPKGNFQVINRCGLTGELLGPPNYHRYNQIVQQHHAARIGGRLPLEAYRSRIESVRDPEVVKQWLDKMRRTTRYTWKQVGAPAATPAETAPAPEGTEATAAPPPAPAVPAFDTLEDARLHLLTHARDRVVRTTESARFPGRLLETLPPGEIRRAVEGALERQRKFPLDTANALRGRLRREHFTIFKKGAKGVSYVCAVKRKFRVPGQTFADSIGALIAFIEANPMVRASELPVKFLGLVRAAPAPAPAAAPAEGSPAEPAPAEAVATGPSLEDRARLARLQGDLMWLVREGYVTEFIDGRLFAPPPMVEARKKEIESEEHDPENFPEAPAAPVPESPLSETPSEPAGPAGEASVARLPEAHAPAPEPEPAAPATEPPAA